LGYLIICHPHGLVATEVFTKRLRWPTCHLPTLWHTSNICFSPSAWSRCWELFRVTSAQSALRSGHYRNNQEPWTFDFETARQFGGNLGSLLMVWWYPLH
jgi:hypothetical protein